MNGLVRVATRYPAIELARDGQIHVSDRTRLLQRFNTYVDPHVRP